MLQHIGTFNTPFFLALLPLLPIRSDVNLCKINIGISTNLAYQADSATGINDVWVSIYGYLAFYCYFLFSCVRLCVCNTSLEFMKRIKCDERRMETNEQQQRRRGRRRERRKTKNRNCFSFFVVKCSKAYAAKMQAIKLGTKRVETSVTKNFASILKREFGFVVFLSYLHCRRLLCTFVQHSSQTCSIHPHISSYRLVYTMQKGVTCCEQMFATKLPHKLETLFSASLILTHSLSAFFFQHFHAKI